MPNKNKLYETALKQKNWSSVSKFLADDSLMSEGFLNLNLNFGSTHPSTYFAKANPEGKALQMQLRFLGLQDIAKKLNNFHLNRATLKAHYRDYLSIALNLPQFKDCHGELLLCYPFSERNNPNLENNDVFHFYSPMHQALVGQIKKAFYEHYKNHFLDLPPEYELTAADFSALDALTNNFCFFAEQIRSALLDNKNPKIPSINEIKLFGYMPGEQANTRYLWNNETPLHRAVCAGNLAIIQHLKAKPYDLAAKDDNHHTVLHLAARNNDGATIRLFLESLDEQTIILLLQIESRDGYKYTPLDYTPLSYTPLQWAVSNYVEDIPLQWAGIQDRAAAVTALLERLSSVQIYQLLQGTDKHSWNPLTWAACYNHPATTTALLTKLDTDQILSLLQLNIGGSEHDEESSYTALEYAAKRNHPDVISAMLEKLPTLQKAQALGISNALALHLAAKEGRSLAIKAMLEKLETAQIKVLLTIKNHEGKTPLERAIEKGHFETLKAMLEKLESTQIKEPLAIKYGAGKTLIYLATERGQTEFLKALFEKLEPPHIKELLDIAKDHGYTPLYKAVALGKEEIIKVLIASLNKEQVKTLLEARNPNNETPLYYAAVNGHSAAITALFAPLDAPQIKALLQIKNNKGDTPLHIAVEKGQFTAIETLVAKLEDAQIKELLEIQNNNGYTPFQRVTKKDEAALATFVEKLEAARIKKLSEIKKGEDNVLPQLPANENVAAAIDALPESPTMKELPQPFLKRLMVSLFKGLVAVLFLTIPVWVKLAKAVRLQRDSKLCEQYFSVSPPPVDDEHLTDKRPSLFSCFRAVYEKEGVFTEKPLIKSFNTFAPKNKI